MDVPIKFIITTYLAVGYFFITTTIGQQCPAPGVQCDACNIVLCPLANGAPLTIANCSEGTRCEKNGTTHQCVPGACNDPNIPRNATCTTPGMVPSAYKCDVAYFCMEANAPPQTECVCPTGEFYDTATGGCAAGNCTRQAAVCNATGEQGNLDEKFCFACDSQLTALVYSCGESGGTDTGGTGGPGTEAKAARAVSTRAAMQCGPYTPVGGNNGGNTSEETPPPTNQQPPPQIEQPPAIQCKINGQRFPDPAGCRTYYQCNAAREPIKMTCTTGRYDPAKFACVSGNC